MPRYPDTKIPQKIWAKKSHPAQIQLESQKSFTRSLSVFPALRMRSDPIRSSSWLLPDDNTENRNGKSCLFWPNCNWIERAAVSWVPSCELRIATLDELEASKLALNCEQFQFDGKNFNGLHRPQTSDGHNVCGHFWPKQPPDEWISGNGNESLSSPSPFLAVDLKIFVARMSLCLPLCWRRNKSEICCSCGFKN